MRLTGPDCVNTGVRGGARTVIVINQLSEGGDGAVPEKQHDGQGDDDPHL